MRANGRGLKRPTVDCSADPDAVTFHVNDAANPEFWLRVLVSRAELQTLVEKMDEVTAECEADIRVI